MYLMDIGPWHLVGIRNEPLIEATAIACSLRSAEAFRILKKVEKVLKGSF